jgi:hypothetical protein
MSVGSGDFRRSLGGDRRRHENGETRALPVRPSRDGQPPAPCGAPAPRGRTHREAPERVSSVQENPKGAADLSKIRRFRLGQTLGRRPDAVHFTGDGRGRKRARGIEATPVAATSRDDVLRRGTPRGRGTCGVTTHVPGRWASSDPASRCFSPCVSERRERRPRRQGIASGAATHRGSVPEEVSDSEGTPWTAAALEAAKRAGREPSRR